MPEYTDPDYLRPHLQDALGIKRDEVPAFLDNPIEVPKQ